MSAQASYIVFEVPIRTVSLYNQREHWAARYRRTKEEREAVHATWLEEMTVWRWHVPIPCTVTLTRIAPRELDDDNLRGALKSVRDEIALLMGLDDRDPRVFWRYEQERASKGDYSVRVEIDGETDPPASRTEFPRRSARKENHERPASCC